DRGVRTPAGLDADDPLGREGRATNEELGVLLRIDVVGDHGHVERVAQAQAQRLRERGLPRADGPSDTDLERTRNRHDLNNLISRRAWRRPASSSAGVKVHMSSAVARAAAAASRGRRGRAAARPRWPSSWPSGSSRSPAPTSSAAVEERYVAAAVSASAPPRPAAAPQTHAWGP